MKQIIDEIVAREAMKTERKVLDISANLYKTVRIIGTFINNVPENIKPSEKKEVSKISSELKEMKKMIEGNIE